VEAAPPRLLYLVTEDWYFVMHRLPMARAARQAVFEVHVATRVARHAGAIEAEGFALHPLAWRRGSFDPLAFSRTVLAIRTLLAKVRPDVIHQVGMLPALAGLMATFRRPVPTLTGLVGLGFTFTGTDARMRALRPLISGLLPRLLDRPHAEVLVENPDDRDALVRLGITPQKINLVLGSGVDVDALTPMPEPPPPVSIGFAGRLIATKGVRTLLTAHAELVGSGEPLRLLIAGEPDESNPSAIPRTEVQFWRARPGVALLGQIADIRALWRQVHIAALPSRGGEGVPMSLLEAAACGRPLVATDVPGCREIARHGETALVVPPDDPTALAAALRTLAGDAALRARLGAAARALAVEKFSSAYVGAQVAALYRRLALRQLSPALE
jgi:glycosyltransferase involved in cell wall biosynthesis